MGLTGAADLLLQDWTGVQGSSLQSYPQGDSNLPGTESIIHSRLPPPRHKGG